MTETNKPTILLVDDEERILRSLKLLLRHEYNIKTTTDGREAIDICSQQKIDVVISDQRMPIMSGVEVLKRIKERSPSTIRILLTGYADLAAAIGSVNEGEIYRFLQKPWNSDEIRSVVASAVEVSKQMSDLANTATPSTLKVRDIVAPPVNPEKGKIQDLVTTTSSHMRTHSTQPGILVLDTDPISHNVVAAAAPDGIPLYSAHSLDEAVNILENEDIGVIVIEVMDGDNDYSNIIRTLKHIHPNLVTVVHTSFKDHQLLIKLINQGQIFRFHPKPSNPKLLSKNLESSLHYHHKLKTQPALAARHKVEKPTNEVFKGFSDRVRSYLRKFVSV